MQAMALHSPPLAPPSGAHGHGHGHSPPGGAARLMHSPGHGHAHARALYAGAHAHPPSPPRGYSFLPPGTAAYTAATHAAAHDAAAAALAAVAAMEAGGLQCPAPPFAPYLPATLGCLWTDCVGGGGGSGSLGGTPASQGPYAGPLTHSYAPAPFHCPLPGLAAGAGSRRACWLGCHAATTVASASAIFELVITQHDHAPCLGNTLEATPRVCSVLCHALLSAPGLC